ncbi:MAG TPA: hypothetical protein VFM46_13840 [Pseudomonadales bacterium]|nr:hypothetical protein [Pseudomonadales bacterium]
MAKPLSAKALEIKLGTRQIKVGEIATLIAELPKKVQGKATRHVAEFYVDKFKQSEPPYKYVSRRSAYPEVYGWFSERQRRYVMARIRAGAITPGVSQRDGYTSRQWTVSGRGPVTISNKAPHAGWLFSDKYQARQPKRVGWSTLGEMQKTWEPDATNDLIEYLVTEILDNIK